MLRKKLAIQLGGAGTESVTALFGLLWKPDDLPAMVYDLRCATKSVLESIAAERKKKLQEVTTRILGYLLLSFVSREWVESQLDGENPFQEIPLDKKISLEVATARLNGTAAYLSSMSRLSLHGEPDAVETFVPDDGWQEEDTFATIVKGIYKSLRPDEKPETLTKITQALAEGKTVIYQLQSLNAAFKNAHERGENNYYLAVNRHNGKHPAQDVNVCRQLKAHLPHLLVIRFGASAEEDGLSILQGDEGELGYLVEDFLNLFNDVNREG